MVILLLLIKYFTKMPLFCCYNYLCDIFESALGVNSGNNNENDLIDRNNMYFVARNVIYPVYRPKTKIIILFQHLPMTISVVFSKPLIFMHFDLSHCKI